MSEKTKWVDRGETLWLRLADWLFLVVKKEPDYLGRYHYWVSNLNDEEFEWSWTGRKGTLKEAKAKAEQIAIDLAERILTSLRAGRDENS